VASGEWRALLSPLSSLLSPLSHHLQAGLLFLLTTQLSVLIYGHLRVYALGGDHFPAHLIGVPFTFGLPLLLALKTTKSKPAPSN
jgi:hypothetical protein